MIVEYMKKGIELGLGAVDVDKKRAKKMAKESVDHLIRAGKITARDAKIIAKEFEKAGLVAEQKIKTRIRSEMDKHASKLGYVASKDVAALRKRVKELEKKLKKKK